MPLCPRRSLALTERTASNFTTPYMGRSIIMLITRHRVWRYISVPKPTGNPGGKYGAIVV